jgi:carboxypeptidase Taq
MTAAQLFDAACRAEPEILLSLANGDFAPLRTWLRANVHEKGSFLETDQLITAATGRPLAADVFESHLHRRYLS